MHGWCVFAYITQVVLFRERGFRAFFARFAFGETRKKRKKSWGDTLQAPRQRAAPLATPLLLRLQKKPPVEKDTPRGPGTHAEPVLCQT